MRIEDVPLYAPCQPHWLCVPFMGIFALLLLIGLVFFIRIIYREYLKIQRAQKCADCGALIIEIVRAVVVRPISNKP